MVGPGGVQQVGQIDELVGQDTFLDFLGNIHYDQCTSKLYWALGGERRGTRITHLTHLEG